MFVVRDRFVFAKSEGHAGTCWTFDWVLIGDENMTTNQHIHESIDTSCTFSDPLFLGYVFVFFSNKDIPMKMIVGLYVILIVSKKHWIRL